MNPATQPAGNADEQQVMKAICYKCKYKTLEPPSSRSCPKCNFPLILQPQDQQSIKMNVREIFDRTSVEVGPKLPGLGKDAVPGAPPAGLPGVPQAAMARAPSQPMGPGGLPGLPQPYMSQNPATARKARVQRIVMAVAFASAIVLGVAAAVVQSAM